MVTPLIVLIPFVPIFAACEWIRKTQFLLIPLSPVFALLCIVVFLYERIFLNSQERVNTLYHGSKAETGIVLIVGTVVALPLSLFSETLGQLIFPVCFCPLHLNFHILRTTFWIPLFRDTVPSIYLSWNARVYRHSRLDPKRKEIRIIEIFPARRSESIKICLVKESLGSEPGRANYDALSYSWGGHLMLRRIIKADNCSIMVTDSVFNALRELRHPTQKTRIWIDAICINQRDDDEKKSQINMMCDIYCRAQRVIVWLGKAPKHSDAVLRAFQNERIPETLDAATGHSQPDTGLLLSALRDIFGRRWWSRVWVVQEVALGKSSIVVRIGENEIPWEKVRRLAGRIITEQSLQLQLNRSALTFVNQVTDLKNVDDHSGARSQPGSGTELLDLAITFRNRVSGDPRDKLYGLVGLLKSKPQVLYLLNERKCASKTFADFTAYHILRDQNLAIMTLAESHSAADCSWAVDWSKYTDPNWAQADPLDIPSMDKMMYPFWSGGLVDETAARRPPTLPYRASGNKRQSRNYPKKGKEWNAIFLEVFEVDTVEQVGEAWSPIRALHNFLDKWERLAGDRASFNRTIVGDAWPGDGPDDWRLWYRETAEMVKEINELIQQQEQQQQQRRQQADDIENRSMWNDLLRRCCARRRLFTTSKGRSGLGPSKMMYGDRICIVPGADVPFIFRKDVLFFEKVETPFVFVGQAYVDGIMGNRNNDRNLIGDMESNTPRIIKVVGGIID